MHRFRRASAGPTGGTKEGTANATENSQRSSATTVPATPAAPFSNVNNDFTDEPAVNGCGKRAAPSPPSSTGFFSNRHGNATPTPRVSDGVSPFAALKHASGNAESVLECQPPASSSSSSSWTGDDDNAPGRQASAISSSSTTTSSLWRGDAPSGAVVRARKGGPSVPADNEHQPAHPVPSSPCFRFPLAAGKQQQAPQLPTGSFDKEHDRHNTGNNISNTNDINHISNTNTNNSTTKNASGHGPSPGGPTPPDAGRKTPNPKSATTHQPRGTAAQPRGTAAPRAGGNARGDGQQERARGSSVSEGSLKRCAPLDSADLGQRNDGGGDSASSGKSPRLRDELQAPDVSTTTVGRKEPRYSVFSPPSLSNNKDAEDAAESMAALPPSSQLDTVMEDHDPFDDLSVAEGAIFADASARIQKLRNRQLSVREGFARSHSRLLQGDAGFKILADAEQLVASTFSLLQEMNLEADAAPGDEDRSQQIHDQQVHNQTPRTT